MEKFIGVAVNMDNYSIVQIARETLEVPEYEAIEHLIEIGLFNILHYPLGDSSTKHRLIDEKLASGKFPKLVKALKVKFYLD